MQIQDYYQNNNGFFQVNREQASRFAKHIAGDFNPIHDPDNKRFCVPGDLLFSLILQRFGLRPEMRFSFSGMVDNQRQVKLIDDMQGGLSLQDEAGKHFIDVEYEGESTPSEEATMMLADAYVRFSGLTFPHLLVPLLEHQDVMINPNRPMVIYASMALHLETTTFENPSLEVMDTQLEVKGKRGNARLSFNIKSNQTIIGTGHKDLLLSGLQNYDEQQTHDLISSYEQRKAEYLAQP